MKLGNWNEALSGVELTDVSTLRGDVIIGRSYGASRMANENHWRLYWCINFESLYRGPKGEDVSEDVHANVILGGMRHFWFALAMLENSGGGLPVLHNMKDQVLAGEFLGRVADSLLVWLEPIIAISERFANEDMKPRFLAENFGRFWWLNGLLKLLCNAADRTWTFGVRWWEGVDRDFKGNCVAWMVANQFIERTKEKGGQSLTFEGYRRVS